MKKDTCGLCVHYGSNMDDEDFKVEDNCYFNPPIATMVMAQTPMGQPQPVAMSFRPVVKASDQGCGNFFAKDLEGIAQAK